MTVLLWLGLLLLLLGTLLLMLGALPVLVALATGSQKTHTHTHTHKKKIKKNLKQQHCFGSAGWGRVTIVSVIADVCRKTSVHFEL